MTAWEQIVNEHGPALFGVATRILGDAADAEDVVQDVFLEAFRMRQRRDVPQWSGLLRRMTACRSLDRLRQRKVTVSLEGIALSARGVDPVANVIGRELAERLREAIAELPPHEGEVFCLRYFEDMPYQQIAEVLNTTGGGVATALHKARAKLEVLLSETVKGDRP
jgi:RNA polymerase sigma-70 factor (ECF subfamily)